MITRQRAKRDASQLADISADQVVDGLVARSGGRTEVSIIIPTYNERDNISLLVWLIAEQFETHPFFKSPSWPLGARFEIIVVDDNSSDGTAEATRLLQQKLPITHGQVKLLSRPGKLGLGTAYLYGLTSAEGRLVILMDADLSHHPKYIPKMLELQCRENADIVTGSRYIRGGGVCGWPFRRILLSRCANTLAQLLLRPKVSDLTGSFRVYKKKVLQNVASHVDAKGYVFQMEIITRARAMGYSIFELPIVFTDRLFGVSKLGAGEILGYLKGLLKLFWFI